MQEVTPERVQSAWYHYTPVEEKVAIGRDYLWPRQVERSGLRVHVQDQRAELMQEYMASGAGSGLAIRNRSFVLSPVKLAVSREVPPRPVRNTRSPLAVEPEVVSAERVIGNDQSAGMQDGGWREWHRRRP